jgi:hypothetical protein
MKAKEIANKEVNLFNSGLEEYPFSTVIIENTLILIWILTGAYLCYSLFPVIGWIYLIFGFSMVLVIMRILVCRNCYYYGKMCHTGWGKLSALYCKQGEITHFGCGLAGKMIPIFYGSMTIIPIIIGIISLVISFSLILLIALLIFITVAILSSITLRKKACEKCKMKMICKGSMAK